jgi:uncharacterized protein YjbI with pentapeptide repeats
MWSTFKPRSIYDVMAVIGCVAAVGTGTAYAANTVFSTDIVDGEVKNVDIGNSQVNSPKIGNGTVGNVDLHADAVSSLKVLDGTLVNADVALGGLTGAAIADNSLTGADISNSSLTGSDIATGSLVSSDIADHTITQGDINGTNHSGAISVTAISNGRCVTITGSVGGAQPGDAAVLTTNGSIPSGMLIYAQRALTDAVDIKVCNLTGATSAAISNIPVRVLTFH